MNATEMLANPSQFGFAWTMGPVSVRAGEHASDTMGLGDVPLVHVTNVALFDATFPGLALKAINGTSIRVTGQRIGRSAREKDRKASDDLIRQKIVAWMLGVRSTPIVTTREVRIYVASDGTEFTDKAELVEYEKMLRE